MDTQENGSSLPKRTGSNMSGKRGSQLFNLPFLHFNKKKPSKDGEKSIASTPAIHQNGSQPSSLDTSTASGPTSPSSTVHSSSDKGIVVERGQMKKLVEQGIKFRRMESDLRAANVETAVQRSRYGTIKELPTDSVAPLESLTETTLPGTEVAFKARVHAIRNMSSNLAFILLRHQIMTVQGVIRSDNTNITRHMVRWAERIPIESIVFVKGQVHTPKEKLISTSYHDVEITVSDIFIVAQPTVPLPFHHYGAPSKFSNDADEPGTTKSAPNSKPASISSGESTYSAGGEDDDVGEMVKPSRQQTTQAHVGLAVRMANRVLDLRSPCSQSIFRVQAAVATAFRSYLNDQGFLEIHTPKLLGGASESGASVFNVNYFGRRACLAQSPQLFKQMCICADFGRVYEVGPVFRAENSNTHRHLTEYTGLDLEMELSGTDYHEAMMLIDSLLKSIFAKLLKDYRVELDTIKKVFPIDDFVWLPETLILEYTKGVQILIDSGYVEENGAPPKVDEDLSTRGEIRLGALVKEKFHTDYYILDKFPAKVRPFYTMPDSKNIAASNSFDVFVRGQEIISGGQRIHLPEMLESNLHKLHIEAKGLEDYLESFRLAAPAHAGCGIGLERFVMLFLGLTDIRNASLFPRDPRSLRETTMHTDDLRHPEATTLTRKHHHHSTETAEFPPSLEKLIANYGDSSNTSWLDDRFTIWRDASSGAAVGYSKQQERAIIIGNPLCEVGQYSRVAQEFLKDIKALKLKPVWLLVSTDFENVLSHNFNWNTLSCNVESRVKGGESEADRKARQATKHDVKSIHFARGEPVSPEWKQKCDKRIADWQASRKEKGKQVHMTSVAPWQDEAHRDYFLITDAKDEVCALVILAQLSSKHGYQIKWALEFPDAPSGAIEYGITTAMRLYPSSNFTFGASAVGDLIAGSNIRGVKAKALESTYHSMVANFHLLNKVDFRKKFGAASDERLWICYPRGGMGPRTIKSIMSFFGA
jgi:nondiscriminating aspartyl-tRNA synthetase